MMAKNYGGRPAPVPVVIRGVRYSTMTEAAIALGVDRSTVSKAGKNGTLDAVGLGPGKYVRKKISHSKQPKA